MKGEAGELHATEGDFMGDEEADTVYELLQRQLFEVWDNLCRNVEGKYC